MSIFKIKFKFKFKFKKLNLRFFSQRKYQKSLRNYLIKTKEPNVFFVI